MESSELRVSPEAKDALELCDLNLLPALKSSRPRLQALVEPVGIER